MKLLKILSLLAAFLFLPASSQATLGTYTVNFADIPPSNSMGLGEGTITLDDATFMMVSEVHFSFVTGTMTAGMLFGPTANPYSGIGGMAANPFTSFPTNSIGRALGTLDMGQSGNYAPAFLAANGGTPAAAFSALKNAADNGQLYIDIKTTTFPDGAIRAYLTPVPEPASIGLLAIGAGMGLFSRSRNSARRK